MIVLGIDPGSRRSGWAIATDHETVADYGVAINASERSGAMKLADKQGVTHVCIEWAQPGSNRVSNMGMGQARGRWLEHIALVLGIGVKSVRLIKPKPNQWRAATHGVVKASGKTSDDRTREYKRAARAFTGIDDPDAAEAACLAMYGAMMVGEEAA